MATPAEIRNKAAFRLGVKGFGMALENAVSSDLDSAYDEVYAYLRSEDLVSWGAAAEVPNELVYPIVSLVAFSRIDEYGVSGERARRISIAAGQAETMIRRTLQVDHFNNSDEANYY